MRNRTWVLQLVEELAGRRFEALHILGGHLRPPIAKTRSNGKPGDFCIKAWVISCSTLVKAEHGLIVGQAQEGAERRAFLGRATDQRFVADFVIQPWSQCISSLPP